ncbi:MAG: DUF4340 domain-containing protein [Bacteroidetes bacterium]|nr:DUF4340 domain-containing protein [Bacteroidota bacterium]
MKKNRVVIILTLLLAVTAAILLFSRNSSTLKKETTNFAVDDTATITRIFMADKASHTVELARSDSGGWRVNKQYCVRPDAIEILLKTMLNVDVMEPVAKSSRNTILKRIASSGVKVEVYQHVFRIDLFGWIQLFPHEKRTRVYYVGSATPDNLGTYMIMEDTDIPYITFIPGFRGFISVRYSPRIEDWRDHTVFNTAIADIKSVRIDHVEVPGFSLEVDRAGERAFSLKSLYSGKAISDYDTMKVLEFLSAFSNIKFEALVNGFSRQKVDSILGSKPFHIITLTQKNGKVITVKTFHRVNPDGESEVDGSQVPYDRDRMYAQINDRKELVLIQFFVFDYIVKPISDFLKAPAKTNSHLPN